MWEEYFQFLLKKKFKKAKLKNSSYSLRAFGQKIGVSSGAISELIAGKRKFSKRLALKIAEKLCLKQEELICLKELIKGSRRLPRKTLTPEQDFIVKNRLYISVLFLLELDFPPKTFADMASRLNLTKKEIEDAMNLLEQRGLIKKENGFYRMTELNLQTTEDIPNEVYQKALQNDLDSVKEAISNLPPNLRECTSITFSGSNQVFSKMREEIRDFRDHLSVIGAQENKNQIYNLTLSLIPLLEQRDELNL